VSDEHAAGSRGALSPSAPTLEAGEAVVALRRAQGRASRVTSLLLPAAALIGLGQQTLRPLAIAGPLALGLLLHHMRAFGAPRSRLPNLVTALRVMATGLLALSADRTTNAASLQAMGVLVIFVLDGLDGVLARKLGASSAQGAHFDMEADAYLVLTVCCLHVVAGVGVWALMGGLLRYAYALSVPFLRVVGEAPRSRFGRYAFATALGFLTVGLLLTGALRDLSVALGTVVLLWSFGRSWWFGLGFGGGSRVAGRGADL